MKRQNQKLYLAQMVAAICVVLIHVGTVVKDPVLHFVIKSLICRWRCRSFLSIMRTFFD